MLDPATITLINSLGSLKAIGISHPHFYTTMVEWSRAFGGVLPILDARARHLIQRGFNASLLSRVQVVKLIRLNALV
jgi:hypothetical protein